MEILACSQVSEHCPLSYLSKIFSSETTWPIKAKFYAKHPWEGRTKLCTNGPGHMTKIAAMPIYSKKPSQIFFSRTGGPISTKLGMYNQGLLSIIVCTNDDPGVNLTYFTTRSNLVLWEKVKTVDFSESTVPCDLKVCRCRQLIEFMKVCEY